MHIKLDLGEHLRFIEKYSVLGVANDDGSYKKNICLPERVKRRIKGYRGLLDKVHAILIYLLLKEDLSLFSYIQICSDSSKSKLRNNLRKLFKDSVIWRRLEQEGKIKIAPVKKCYVHYYVQDVRKNKGKRDLEIDYDALNSMLRLFDRK
ncbi:MAG: hypothetical protein WC471_03850 [Candidatus Woesearchaeota archaeon]